MQNITRLMLAHHKSINFNGNTLKLNGKTLKRNGKTLKHNGKH
jgi:hypothetical protein